VNIRQKRIALIAGGLLTIGVATALVMNALNSNIAFFVTPTEVLEGKAPQDKAFRIGGLVKEGSIRRDNLTVHFMITDTAKEVPVTYTGILPDLFKEGKGAVAQGRSGPMAVSRPPRCWPSTTRTTCRRKRSTPSTKRRSPYQSTHRSKRKYRHRKFSSKGDPQ
jgi:cytochrome c-type biogenesis protein CcmE